MSPRNSIFSLLTSLCLLVACTGAPVVTPTVAPTTAPTATEMVATATVMPSPVPPTETASPVPPTDTPTIPAPTFTPAPPERLAFIARTSTRGEPVNVFYTYLPGELKRFITLINSDGSQPETPFTRHDDVVPSLSVSPDGRTLVFHTYHIGPEGDSPVTTDFRTYFSNLGTHSLTELKTPKNVIPDYFSWSPDSQRVAFVQNVESENNFPRIFIRDLNKQLTSPLFPEVGTDIQNLYPSWSPDGQYIAFIQWQASGKTQSYPRNDTGTNQGSLYIVRPDGTDLHLLVEPIYIEADLGEHYLHANYLAWSFDNKWIAYLVGSTTSDIAIINIETGEIRQLTNNLEKDLYPSWSPDGSNLVFFSKHDGNEEIYTVTSEGQNLKNLTAHAQNDFMPVWSPSGQRLAFLSDRDFTPRGHYQLFTMNADGSNIAKVSDAFVSDPPVWLP